MTGCGDDSQVDRGQRIEATWRVEAGNETAGVDPGLSQSAQAWVAANVQHD